MASIKYRAVNKYYLTNESGNVMPIQILDGKQIEGADATKAYYKWVMPDKSGKTDDTLKELDLSLVVNKNGERIDFTQDANLLDDANGDDANGDDANGDNANGDDDNNLLGVDANLPVNNGNAGDDANNLLGDDANLTVNNGNAGGAIRRRRARKSARKPKKSARKSRKGRKARKSARKPKKAGRKSRKQ